jgi:hypothetical protein
VDLRATLAGRRLQEEKIGRMKRIQDMTVREWSRLLAVTGAIPVVGIISFALIVQEWLLFAIAALAAGGLAVLFLTDDRNTREDS